MTYILMIIHESTLNIKLAAVPTLWSISPLPPPPEDAHQHIQWVRGSRHLYTCMHACMYVCICVRWWLASGMRMQLRSIVCESWQHHACMYDCPTEWSVQCMVDDWWMDDCRLWWIAVVMLGSFLWKSDRVNMVDWMNEWMNEWMHACMDWLLFVCVFMCVYVVGWFGRLVCRVEESTFEVVEKEPLRIAISLQIVQAV